MATFSKHEVICASPQLIPDMAKAIRAEFAKDGFEIRTDNLYSGGVEISITKGGFFKAVLGLKTALKISLQPRENIVLFDANVGIFGQQVIPTIITLFVTWPVILTQIWGLVQQSKLDDRALEAAQRVVAKRQPSVVGDNTYCHQCGKAIPQGARFCPFCGAAI